MSIIDQVRAKIDEYGLEVFSDYPLVDGDEYVFFTEDMILFVNKKEESIGISFQASTRPDRAAKMILIINEIEIDINIMESFIFNRNNEYLSGEKAFDLIEKTKKSDAVQNFVKDQMYKEILLTSDCHEC
jgi:hypothetical protein